MFFRQGYKEESLCFNGDSFLLKNDKQEEQRFFTGKLVQNDVVTMRKKTREPFYSSLSPFDTI